MTSLTQFVEDGGVLLRFAGTHLAGASDDLVPVRLRRGGRVLGGALSWETPKKLAPFDRQSPFFGLTVPDEVTISRQVLAEPDAGLSGQDLGAASDGTPLVTAEQRGKGMIVLFHVTADTTWSNLPLSGLFVDMLRKIVALSTETAKTTDKASRRPIAALQTAATTKPAVAPRRTLDGFGVLGAPPADRKSPFPPISTASAMRNIRRAFTARPMRFSRSMRCAPDDVIQASGLFRPQAPDARRCTQPSRSICGLGC